MRILTVRQPWAWAIIHGGKNVENRVRNIAGDYRGPVLIHAAKAFDLFAYDENENYFDEQDERYAIRGAIIGVVDLAGIHRADDCVESGELCSPWAQADSLDTVHMVLANPRVIDEPIPYKGALGLRKIDLERLTTPQLYALAVATS